MKHGPQTDRMSERLPREPSLEEKIRFLSRCGADGSASGPIEVLETQMAWVFLTENRVLKLKKPVTTDYLDFSTLERRNADVRDEIRLNRRLALDVYLGARALFQKSDGALSLNGEGRIVDWLVEMQRLPAHESLDARIAADHLARTDIERVADVLAGFYAALPAQALSATELVEHFEAEHAKTSRVLRDKSYEFDGCRVEAALSAFESDFDRVRPELAKRVGEGRIVEGHGDLRPEHVFLTEPPVIIDCLEFSKKFRTLDPFEEVAYLGLECALLGCDWVFAVLERRIADLLNDPVPPALLVFYWRYRALLRARLSLLHLSETQVRSPEKWRPLAWRFIALAEEAEIRIQRPADQ